MNFRGATTHVRDATGRAASALFRSRRFVAALALLAATFGLQLLASLAPRFVERFYSRLVFPEITRALSLPSLPFDFSLGEALLAALAVSAVAWLAWQARGLYRRQRRWQEFLFALFTSALLLAASTAALFMLVFGLNYQREYLSESLRLVRREPDAAEAEAIARELLDGVNRNYEEARAAVRPDSGSVMPFSREELYRLLEDAFPREPLLNLPETAGLARPKPVYFDGTLSRLGISGVYSPFTAEPNYNDAQPDSIIPFTVAHEMAHQRGYAREAEASFVAFLVCKASAHPYVRYSGYVGGLVALSALQRLTPQRRAELFRGLGDGPRADLQARSRFWSRYVGRASALAQSLNHAYLKANGVRSGVRNYNEAAWLVVGYYLKRFAEAGPPPVAAREKNWHTLTFARP
ncbi:MAG TPA: DUF3810 domain-containing protein [Pyrinomonadaceae bacterium]|jgi:hypothetical protein|nr:DUF3810 domain-containing protein [Pyrinomonadaceae bacterium]